MILWTLMISLAMAAWPDSFEHRIAAMDALRFDLSTPDIDHNPKEVARRYRIACQKGYAPACKWKEWQTNSGGDPEIAATFFEKKCKSKEPMACVIVGMKFGLHRSSISDAAKDPDKAFALFRQSCKEKAYAPACSYMGLMYERGVSVKKNLKKSAKLYEEGCKAKDYWGCERLARLQLAGTGVKKDKKKAEKNFSKACNNGSLLSCGELAVLIQKRSNKSADRRKIAGHFSTACKIGAPKYCLELAHLHVEGKGVKRSHGIAKGLYGMSCARGVVAGCHGSAEMLLKSGDADGAVRKFKRACERGYAPSCSRRGQQLLSKRGGNVKLALELLTKGCDGGDADGCLYIADAYRIGEHLTKDINKATALYRQSCDKDIGKACYQLARLSAGNLAWHGTSDLPLYKKSCKLGYGRGCGELAERRKLKEGMSKRVIKLLNQGCDGKSAQSCSDLADYRLNKKRDKKGSIEYLERACSFGGNDSCLRVGKIYLDSDNITEALRLFETACTSGDERGCKAAEPIAFRGRFSELSKDAFSSRICQIWAMNPENPEDVLPVADVRGAQFMGYVGKYRSDEVSASFLNEEHSSGKKYEGKSHWSLMGMKKEEVASLEEGVIDSNSIWGVPAAPKKKSSSGIWGTGSSQKDKKKNKKKKSGVWGGSSEGSWTKRLTHVEVWDPKNGEVNDVFPGPIAYLRSKDGNIEFTRESGLLKPTTKGCRFILTQPVLQAEHCSEVQALIAAYMVMDCSARKVNR